MCEWEDLHFLKIQNNNQTWVWCIIYQNYVFKITYQRLPIRGVHGSSSQDQPAGPTQNRPATTWLTNPTVGDRLHPHNLNPSGRLAGFLSKNPSHLTWPSPQQHLATFKGFPTKNNKYWWYFCFFDEDLLEIHQIWWDPAIFRRDLVQIRWIRPNIGQISPNPVKFRHWQRNPKPTKTNPKTDGPEPDYPTINTGWFQFWFSPTRIVWVGSGLGTNPTWPHPWTPLLPITKISVFLFICSNSVFENKI